MATPEPEDQGPTRDPYGFGYDGSGLSRVCDIMCNNQMDPIRPSCDQTALIMRLLLVIRAGRYTSASQLIRISWKS